MSDIQTNQPIYNRQNGIPLYPYGNYKPAEQKTVTVTSPQNNAAIYQYPQTSIYNDPNKQAASGVNIYIYNPSAIGAPNSTANATYTLPYSQVQPQVQPQQMQDNQAPAAAQSLNAKAAVANTPISNTVSQQNTGKTKQIVELTDDYIKSLESYLKNQDSSIRQAGITELIKRFEEDDSRYNDPALTALLNIALQDPTPNNRVLAMSVIAGGKATGDKNTKTILDKLQQSDKLFGQEAIMANKSLLQSAQHRITVPDNSAPKTSSDDDKEE